VEQAALRLFVDGRCSGLRSCALVINVFLAFGVAGALSVAGIENRHGASNAALVTDFLDPREEPPPAIPSRTAAIITQAAGPKGPPAYRGYGGESGANGSGTEAQMFSMGCE
jgi:hypothetical protein